MSESCLQYLYNKKKQIKRERESANFWQFAQLFWFLIVSRHNAIHCALCHIFDSLLKKTYAHFLFGTHYTCQLYSQSSKFYSILSIIDDHFNTLYTIRMLHSFKISRLTLKNTIFSHSRNDEACNLVVVFVLFSSSLL